MDTTTQRKFRETRKGESRWHSRYKLKRRLKTYSQEELDFFFSECEREPENQEFSQWWTRVQDLFYLQEVLRDLGEQELVEMVLEKAQEVLDKKIAAEPTNGFAWLLLVEVASLYIQQGNHQRGQEIYSQLRIKMRDREFKRNNVELDIPADGESWKGVKRAERRSKELRNKITRILERVS